MAGPSEVDAIFLTAAADPSIFGARDAAVIALLGDAGLEADELTRLELSDFDAESACVRVARAGGTARVALPATAAQAVARWALVRGPHAGALLHPLKGSGQLVRKPISRVLVHDVVRRRSRAAGLLLITPGDLTRARGAGFRCPAAAVFLARHGHSMRKALTSRLDRLAGFLSGGAHDAQTYDWTSLTAGNLSAMAVPEGVGQRRLNEMRTALFGVLREGVKAGAIPLEEFEAIQKQVWAAARRTMRDA